MIVTPHIVAMVTCVNETLVSMVICDVSQGTLTTLPCLSPNTWRNQIGDD